MGYSSTDVRKFLQQAFSDEEIETLCFDYFPELHGDFSAGMSKGEKIQRLIDYCQRYDLIQQLFSALQRARPDQYRERFGEAPPPSQLEPAFPSPGRVPSLDTSLPAYAALTDQLIANQHRAIRYSMFFAVGLVALGVAVVAVAFIPLGLIEHDILRSVIGLGGLLVCSLSAFQFREIVNRREKMGVCETVKSYLGTLEQTRGSVDVETRRRVENLLWQVMEKTAVG